MVIRNSATLRTVLWGVDLVAWFTRGGGSGLPTASGEILSRMQIRRAENRQSDRLRRVECGRYHQDDRVHHLNDFGLIINEGPIVEVLR